MSVQTQIDRISGAVSAALAALKEKGVTVPDGTKVDGLAALIAAIEAGGGSGGLKFAKGTYIPTSDIEIPKTTGEGEVYIPTGTDFYPRMYFFWETASAATSSTSIKALHFACGFVTSGMENSGRKGVNFAIYYGSSTTSFKYDAKTTITSNANSGDLARSKLSMDKFKLPNYGSYYSYLFAGREYCWLVVGDEE